MEHRSLFQLFEEVAGSDPDRTAYRSKKDGRWVDLTWGETRDVVHRVAAALIALDVKKGDRVCILANTRVEWALADLGIVSAGAVTVGIYPSSLPVDCAYVIGHSDAGIVFVENGAQLAKVLEGRDDLPQLRHIVLMEGRPDPAHGVLSWDEFLARGADVADEHRELRGRDIEPDDMASIVYTSGTTGVPKGAMITHGNLLFTTGSVIRCLLIDREFVTLMFLPLAHVFARLIAWCCLRVGTPMAFAVDITTVAENMKEIRPQFIASVPRVYEKVYDRVLGNAEAAGGTKLKLFQWAIGVGLRVSRRQQEGKSVPPLLAIQRAVADRLVLHKIRDALGGRLVWAVSGAAPLNKLIAEFFHACGVTILEGIGMTENTSFSNVNRLDANKFGTVGQVGPGIEQRIAEDGEVLFRGPNVMRGYFKNPEATAETIDADGWLHSGDIGEIDADGFLRITDRKKDLIITAGGKNVAPQRIERILRTSRYIAQVVAYGDRRKYVSALVTLDPDNIRDWAQEHGLGGATPEELAAHPRVHELIRGEIDERNRQLASFETVKRFRILPRDLSIEEGELTPTLKIKRKVVYERYARELNALYEEKAPVSGA